MHNSLHRSSCVLRSQPLPLARAVIMALAAWSLPAFADDPASAKSAKKDEVTLEAVTVNARRASELAKDVPFSVSVVSGEEGESRRLLSLEDMLRQTPGVDVVVNMGMSNTSLRLRGVGALQKVSGDDSSVVINVDGLPQSPSNASLNVLDAERVEVLKGPQGTLFGRNSEAGAVNIVTRKPTDWLEGYVRAELGQDHQHLVEGVISGPLTDTLSARLALRQSGIDNVLTNAQNGKPLNKLREVAMRGALRWQPSARTQLLLSAGEETIHNRDNVYTLRPYGEPAQISIPPGAMSNRRQVARYTAELSHEFDAFTLTALSGFADTDHRYTDAIYEGRTYQQLVGFLPDGSWSIRGKEKLYNQEIRLGSKPGEKVFWVAGVNLFHNDRSMERYQSYDTFYPANPYHADSTRQFETDTQAVFGEMTVPLGSAFKLTSGLRYTWEKKSTDANWTAKPDNPNPIRTARDSQSLSDSYLTGRLALSYALTPQVNLYGVYARGYKTGGFNDEGTNYTNGLADLPYKAATVDSYETGFKFESADRRLALNGALFFNKVKDDHLLAYDVATFAANTENYDTNSRGLELEGVWKPVKGWSLSAGVAYTDARISNGAAGRMGNVAKDNRVPEVPKWSGVLSISHEQALPGLPLLKSPVLHTKLSNRFVGSRPADPQNTFSLGAYSKLDLRVGLQSGNTEFYLWADNLLDKRYDLYGYYIAPYMPDGSGAQIGSPGRGRAVGIGMNMAF
ncbi:TonB-dependent receptor [Aquaspirillum sp. LM1]|uniref:TonB-dependent receptor n=1 Tax=Aquaspirillum sp. LM1 TaxID=1938604 RepID=UPI00098507E5|nr:TonB-dependent receptor [Aquaspirillum sp. LM1]